MFDRLRFLWLFRESLSRAEWEELYTLVRQSLLRARLLSTHLHRDELIHDFFADKLLLGKSNAASDTEASLLFYFKRYQLDRLPASPTTSLSPVSSDLALAPCACEPGPSPDYALFLAQRSPAIQIFFENLMSEEKILIALVHCDDHSVLEVEQQHAIRSCAYRAKQLGVSLSKNALPTQWAASKLGQLVTRTLAIAPSTDNRLDLAHVFRLLCTHVATWWKKR